VVNVLLLEIEAEKANGTSVLHCTGREHGTGRDGTGRDGAGRSGTGRAGTGRDGTGRDGTGRAGTGRAGTGRSRPTATCIPQIARRSDRMSAATHPPFHAEVFTLTTPSAGKETVNVHVSASASVHVTEGVLGP
jgi:hypothetical protein